MAVAQLEKIQPVMVVMEERAIKMVARIPMARAGAEGLQEMVASEVRAEAVQLEQMARRAVAEMVGEAVELVRLVVAVKEE